MSDALEAHGEIGDRSEADGALAKGAAVDDFAGEFLWADAAEEDALAHAELAARADQRFPIPFGQSLSSAELPLSPVRNSR